MAVVSSPGRARGRGRRDSGVLGDILSVCPAAVAPVARALHIRMPMQNSADRDDIAKASVRCVPISFFALAGDGQSAAGALAHSPSPAPPCPCSPFMIILHLYV